MTNRKRDIMKEIYFTKLNYFRNGFSSENIFFMERESRKLYFDKQLNPKASILRELIYTFFIL